MPWAAEGALEGSPNASCLWARAFSWKKLQQAVSEGRYIPPHHRSKQLGESGALETPVMAQGQAVLINATVKTSGTGRRAIVARYHWVVCTSLDVRFQIHLP